MDGVVLRAGVGFQDRGIRRALQAPDHGHSQLSRQIRVLAVGFHPASPAGIAEDIDVRSPESNTLVLLHVPRLTSLAVLHARFVTDSCKYFVQKRFVKGSRHADRLREDSGRPVAGHAVQRLAPPVVSPDAQGGHRRGSVHRQRRFLLQGQTGNQVRRPFFRGKTPVFVRLGRQGRGQGA